MAKYTRQAIMLCLLKLLEEKSIDKITVKDICERCEINRNTFYYYFSDIYEVLDALIEYETEQSLKEEDAEASFYEELLQKYHLVLNYRKAIGHLYTSKNRELISNYFYTVTEAFVMKHVQKEAEGMNVPEEDIRFIVDFYSNSLIGMMLRWIKEKMPAKKDHLIEQWSMSYQATVKILLQGCLAEQHPGASVFKRQAHDPLP